MIHKTLRLFAVIILIVALCAAVFPASAQSGWTAYLFNTSNGQIVQVGPGGEQASYALGNNPEGGEYLSSFNITITPDGKYAAYCLIVYPPQTDTNPPKPQASYILRDIAAEQDVVRVDMGSPISCSAGPHNLSPDGSLIAIGKVNSFPGDPNADPNLPLWSINVLETMTGKAQYELNNRSPLVADSSFDTTFTSNPILPLIVEVDDTGLAFQAARYASEGRLDTAFRWDFTGDQYAPVDVWGKYGLSQQTATDEFAYTELDSALPAGDPGGPIPTSNVVRLLDQARTVSTVFVGGADWLPLNTVFVNDGRDLAIMLLESFKFSEDPNIVQRNRWLLLNRDGSSSDIFLDDNYATVMAVTGGYLLFVQDFQRDQPNNFPTFSLTDASGSAIWQSPPADSWQNWELLWVSPAPQQSELPPFTPVG